MKDDQVSVGNLIAGRIKWFDPVKGFGFLADEEGGPDVFLHGNVLRSFGQSSIVEGALIEVMAVQTPRGRQAAEVMSIMPASLEGAPPIAELATLPDEDLAALPLLPGRVKWFNRNKGFGFANVFGREGDVFLHVEVLRRFGFTSLVPGEAVCLRVFAAERGIVAVEVATWDKAASRGMPAAEHAVKYQAAEMVVQ